jgi:DNA-binding MarR family transcriptional regulator
MSTRFTKRGTPLLESRSLRLVLGAGAVRDLMVEHVARELKAEGYEEMSAALLGFLGALDCSVATHAAEIARGLNVSRQMVGKMVKELCRVGYLEQVEGPGRQKQILFTVAGEQLMSDVRRHLAHLDRAIVTAVGAAALKETIETLEAVGGLVGTKLLGR